MANETCMFNQESDLLRISEWLLKEPLFYVEEEKQQQVRGAETTGGHIRLCCVARALHQRQRKSSW